jgi:predicted RND superfamily exporter protein
MNEPIDKIKKGLKKLDYELDKSLSSTIKQAEISKVTAREYKDRIVEGGIRARIIGEKTKKTLDEKGDEVTKRLSEVDLSDISSGIIQNIINHPERALILISIISMLIAIIGLPTLINNINGDMEIYLPEKGDTRDIVNEIRTEPDTSWSVDIAILFITTENAFDTGNITNVTDVRVLREMSALEEVLNPNRTDYGLEDGVRFILSLSTVIKEANNTPPQFEAALEKQFPNAGFFMNMSEFDGNYSIPGQSRVDDIVRYIPDDFMSSLAVDSNNDTYLDTAGIIVAFDKNISTERMVKSLENAVEQIPTSNIYVKVTGPVVITQSLTERTYEEIRIILPLALILVSIVLVFFHRNIKIVFIEGIPIAITMAITFGVLGTTGWVIPPQALLVAPVLIPLGVAYGLYITNRYCELKDKIWNDKERMRQAIYDTSRPIFLSAVTTSIGFASLLTANMLPMKILGFGLSLGIIVAYIVTTLTVPSLALLLKYEKKTTSTLTSSIKDIPIQNRKKILALALLITLVSVSLLDTLTANMDLLEMAPQDDESITTMREYSERFNGGQMSVGIINAQPYNPSTNNIRSTLLDVDVLDNMETLEERIRAFESAKPVTIVDIMKVVRVPDNLNFSSPVPLPSEYVNISEMFSMISNTSFWEVVHILPDENIPGIGKSAQQIAMELFYDTLSMEMKGMLVNGDYSKTLIYIDIPGSLDTVEIKELVTDINEELENKGPAISSTSKLTGFAPILVEINDMLFTNSMQTLAWALVMVLIVLIILFRSIKHGTITMIPILFVIAWQPLCFYVLGIDLNLLTAIIGSIMVGMGIDFCIHMTEKVLDEKKTIEGVAHSVETQGLSFLETTITVVVGISAVFYAKIPSINQFIVMVMFLLLFSMVGALFILPAVYALDIMRK